MRRTTPSFSLTNKTKITLFRRGKDKVEFGRPVKGDEVELEVWGNVQPLRFRDLQQLPESDRAKEWIKIYSVDPIYAATQGADGHQADEVLWDNYRWRVMKSHKYQMGVLDHSVAYAARLEVSAL